MIGKVYLIGAGPGDPWLITVKGLELIKKADVIIYDFLVNKNLLTFAKEDAELICAGKSSLHHSMEQNDINELLAGKASEVKMVVRLKNGDPFIFGRGAEEADYLAKLNIPCHVVPGVSSATAVPASCGVPLTHRDYSSSAAIITGHRKADGEVKFVDADTLVFLMAVANLKMIINGLIKKGKSPDTPCMLIEKGTLESQKVVRGNLGNILKKSKRKNIKPPAVFVVGEVVELARGKEQGAKSKEHRAGSKELRAKSSKPKILFTGTDPQRFKNLGEILHQPMIKIVSLDDYTEVEKEIKRIDKYHWIIFTSRYGVKYFFDILAKSKELRAKSKELKICAIGRATANELKGYGAKASCIPQKESSQGIVETLKKFNLKGKNILIPRSNLSSDCLPCSLRKMGAYVKAIPVYRNILPLKFKKVNINEVDEIIFTSPSTIENFIRKYKDIPEGIRIKCIGDVTLSKLRSYGFSGEVIRQ